MLVWFSNRSRKSSYRAIGAPVVTVMVMLALSVRILRYRRPKSHFYSILLSTLSELLRPLSPKSMISRMGQMDITRCLIILWKWRRRSCMRPKQPWVMQWWYAFLFEFQHQLKLTRFGVSLSSIAVLFMLPFRCFSFSWSTQVRRILSCK